MKVSTVLDSIDIGSIALPEFQRGFVWSGRQVRGLMHSLYQAHPVGSLLVWVTKTESAATRGDGELAPGSVKLLLDGQQRMTSLYGIIRGNPPDFFDGNANAFTGLYFNLDEQTFEFYSPTKMKDNPLWIDVSDLMQTGVGEFIRKVAAIPELQPRLDTYINRLTAIGNIKERDLHVEEVTGEDKTIDVVVDIFNRVNSGGTKLSKGDLALARICGMWPEARDEMKERLAKWEEKGFDFELDWFLRCINTALTGEALFSALKDVDTASFRDAMKKAERAIDMLLNMVSSRLGLDYDRVLGGRYAFPLMVRYLTERGIRLEDHKERDKLLYWYINTFLWGRYAGSTESTLNQDLALIEEKDGALDRLISQMRQLRADLHLSAEDFVGWSRGARFYPLMYMLTRVCKAKDFDTGIELSKHSLGGFTELQLHHIFPKSQLYDRDYSKAEVNAIANFTFLTQETNIRVSDRLPEDYLSEVAEKQPGVVESHWIPMDRELWKIENYLDFLAARRELLAEAANEFLDSLVQGTVPEAQVAEAALERSAPVIPGGVGSEAEEQLLKNVNDWVLEQGLPKGEYLHELVDEETGEPIAVLDLAWPDGLQEGLSSPIALLIDEESDTLAAANGAGFRCFTHATPFRSYVRNEILAEEESAPAAV